MKIEIPNPIQSKSIWNGLDYESIGSIQSISYSAGLGSRDSVSGVLRELGWQAVEDMIVERDLCTMYKLIHDVGAPELLRSRIVSRSDVSVRSTRSTDNKQLEVTRTRTEFGRRCFFSRAAQGW